MDPLMIFLRIVHVGLGLFWAGSAIFVMVVLNRRLKALEPSVSARTLAAMAPVAASPSPWPGTW